MKPEVGDWIMFHRSLQMVIGQVIRRGVDHYGEEDRSYTTVGVVLDRECLEIRKSNKEKS